MYDRLYIVCCVVYVFMCTYYYIPQLVRLRELNENRICIFPLFYCTRLFLIGMLTGKKKTIILININK